MKKLEIVKNADINGILCNFYSDGTGEFYMTRQQRYITRRFTRRVAIDWDSLHLLLTWIDLKVLGICQIRE